MSDTKWIVTYPDARYIVKRPLWKLFLWLMWRAGFAKAMIFTDSLDGHYWRCQVYVWRGRRYIYNSFPISKMWAHMLEIEAAFLNSKENK